MNTNDLRKLSRVELLELLIRQSKEIDRLRAQLEETQQALENKDLAIANAGSLAEAAVAISGVMNAAQQAADQYLSNITKVKFDCEGLIRSSQEQADAILLDARTRSEEMCRRAEEESRVWWDEKARSLEAFYRDHPGLREALAQEYTEVQGK